MIPIVLLTTQFRVRLHVLVSVIPFNDCRVPGEPTHAQFETSEGNKVRTISNNTFVSIYFSPQL